MILTKAKENKLNLTPGVKDVTIKIIEALSCGNYWVDWAESFVSICQDTLGLEIEKGPGTSVGLIYYDYNNANVGTGLNQYDCDWTQPNGKIPEHEYLGEGISLWKNIELWGNDTNSSSDGLDDEVTINLLNIGIDKKNKRFDFIVWFTTDEPNKERLGLRFKYPLTTQRVFGSFFAIGETPVILPWKKNNQTFNDYYKNLYWNVTPSNKNNYINFSQEEANRIINFNNIRYITTTSDTHFTSATKAYFDEQHYNWKHYTEFPEEGEDDYNTLAGINSIFYTRQNGNAISYFRGVNNFNKVKIIVSKNKKIINFGIFNGNEGNDDVKDDYDNCAFNIVYGDLVEDNNVIKSFILLSAGNSADYMGNMLMTEDSYIMHPPKQVNRPSIINTELPSYCGISRVLLQNQVLYCSELYQVFNFNSLMNDYYSYNEVFIDKNNLEHPFIVFNFGDRNPGSNTLARNYSNAVAFAVPI